MSTAMSPKVLSNLRGSGFARSGWMARTTMAQMSWKIKIPTVSRPGAVSISACSESNFTTIMVEEMAQTQPMYMAEYWPSPQLKPSDSKPTKSPVMMPAHNGNWKTPVRITTLPILRSSETSSSKPIMKSKKIKPSELSSAISDWLCTMSRPMGPTSTPPSRYPRMSGSCKRFTKKAMRPALAKQKAMLTNSTEASPPNMRCSPSAFGSP
mmetsp:Transcript_129024/g.412579  ORF Transcript_129024/g.412579 Transcript_129024/m.412579 type:complete len:210 (+) Transcript_129024:1345-1974(+)